MPGTKTIEELFKEFNNILDTKSTFDEKEMLIICLLNKTASDITTATYNGKTLLDIAVEKKCSSSIVKNLIIVYLIDVQTKDSLHVAVKNKNIKVVNVLLENYECIKLDLNKEDEKGLTALDYAEHNSKMYTLLESHGAEHNKKYKYLHALGIKMEDFDEDKLKTDGEYCFDMLEKVLDKRNKEKFEESIKYFVEQGYFDVLNTKKEGLIAQRTAEYFVKDTLRINDTFLREKVTDYLTNSGNKLDTDQDLLDRLTFQYCFHTLRNALEVKDTALREKVMGYLITQGAKVDQEGRDYIFNKEKITLLGEMIEHRRWDTVELLLKLGAKEVAGKTLNDVNLIKDLLKNIADIVKLQDHNGNTLLHLAIKNNSKPEIVEVLLSNGADPYLTNRNELTALGLVAKDSKSDLKIAELLVQEMAEIASSDRRKTLRLKRIINARSDEYGFKSKTLLERALLKGNDNLARLLVLAGAREGINIQDGNGKDIFDRSFCNNFASEWWHIDEFINPLIEKVLKERDTLIMEQLLKHERTKNLIIEKTSNSAYLVAKIINNKSDSNTQFLKCLIQNKILSVNTEINNKPLLQLACEENNLPMAELLIELGADIYAKIEQGYTSVDYVAVKGNEDFIKLFIAATKNHEESERTKLLSSAMLHAAKGFKITIDLLLDNGADITHQDTSGNNIFHIFANSRRLFFVMDILKGVTCMCSDMGKYQNEDVIHKDIVLALSAKNKEGKTPIDEANKLDLPKFSSYLKEYQGRKVRETLFSKSNAATASITLGIVILAAAFKIALLYDVAAVVAIISIAYAAYKIHDVNRSIDQETKGVNEHINSRLDELTTQQHNNSANLGGSVQTPA